MLHVTRLAALMTLSTGVFAASSVGVLPTALAETSYDASAAADAFDLTLTNQSIPLGLTIQGQGPLARVRQTSLDTSDAFAAFPYPGDGVAQLPGLLGGLIGVPAPTYPLLAQTSKGDKPATTTYPGVELQAESADIVTRASAVAGTAASGGTSKAQVIRSAGGVSARASADANGLVLGNVLTVSGAHSDATARRDEDGTLTRDGHLSFAHIGVPGLTITLPRETPSTVPAPVPVPLPVPVPQPSFPPVPLPFGGQTLPAPDLAFKDGVFAVTLPGLGSTRYAVPSRAVFDGLRAIGIAGEYQAGRQTRDGVVSPGLVLKTVLPAPPGNPAGISGPSTVTMTFGFSTASVSASVLPSGTDVPGSTSTGPPGTSSTGASSTALPGSAGASLDPPLAPGAPPSSSDLGTVSSPDLPSSPAVATEPQVQAPEALAAFQLTRPAKAQDLSWLYLLFVVSALLSFASTTVLRYLGVRRRWQY